MSVLGSGGLSDSPLYVAGGALFTFLGGLFALLVNTLLKLGTRADSLNSQQVKDKDKRIAQLERERDADREAWETERAQLKQERDYWFKKYDVERGGRQDTDTREDTP